MTSVSKSFASGSSEILAVAGPSGVGKSTIIQKLMAEFPNKFGFSVSHTTRKMRPGEINGVHYHFVDVETMEKNIQKGEFIEWAKVHSNLYGTSIKAVENVCSKGLICILDLDVQGILSVKKSILKPRAYVFLVPPSIETLKQRLVSRGESQSNIEKRLETAEKELKYKDNFDIWTHQIVSADGIDGPYSQFRKIVLEVTSLAENDSVLSSERPHNVSSSEPTASTTSS